MVKIVKTLRHLKVLIKNSLYYKDIKFQLQHSSKNIIDLDSDENI
jgi:hypothetical protein